MHLSSLKRFLSDAGVVAEVMQNTNGLELRIGPCRYYVAATVGDVVDTIVAHNNFQWNEVVWG